MGSEQRKPRLPLPEPKSASGPASLGGLLGMVNDNDALLGAALAGPGTARGKLAASLLAQNRKLGRLYRQARKMDGEEKAEAYRTIADELSCNAHNTDSELTFVAMHGSMKCAKRAIGELSLRGAMYELHSVFCYGRDDENRALAFQRMWESERMLDSFLSAAKAYMQDADSCYMRDFLFAKRDRRGLDTGIKKDIALFRRIFCNNGGSSWPEFQSDLSLLPIALRVAETAIRLGRVDDAREVFGIVMGKKLLASIGPALSEKEDFTIEGMLSYFKKDECGQKLMRLLEEWMAIKDELLGEEFTIMHDLLSEDIFIVNSEEEALMLLLPPEIRKLVAGGIEKNLDVLVSPLLTEGEKEESTGMNEKVARISLNLGLIKTPLPEPFSDSAAFEKHMKKVIGVLREKYTDDEIRCFAANRTITAIMEGTEFQKGLPHALIVLQKLEGSFSSAAPESSLEREIIREVLARLRSTVEFHKCGQESHGIDFYQSIRIKAFMDSRRILVADGTGTGKTIVALGSKCALDEQLAAEGRRAKVLVLAPSTGTEASWGQEKMDQYCEKFGFSRQNVFIVRNQRDLRDFEAKAAEADMVILGYGKLMNLEQNRYIEKVFKTHFDAVFVDECHNIKNFSSYRGICAKAILWKYRKERCLLLSATPLPNTINDGIGMLLYALDPVKNSEADKYNYNNDPQRVSDFWMGQRWFRRTLEDMKEVNNVRERVEEVELSETEADCYFRLWRECAFTGIKLAKLQRFLIDSDMARRHGTASLAKLECLDRIVEEAAAAGKKVVIWTPWVTGVVDSLQDRYARHGAVKIDGRMNSLEKRYRTAEAFRKSRFINVVIISRVADEGIDLSCGERPAVLVRLVPPLTPREEIQTGGRVDRRTQSGPVEIVTMVAKSERLTRTMLAFANEELSELGFTAPRGFMAQTIDRDVELLLRWKRSITDKVFRGERLSPRQMSIWKAASIEQARGCLSSSLFQTMKKTPPFVKAIFMDHGFRHAGVEKIAEAMDGNLGRMFALLYEEGWEGSQSQHTHLLIASKIRQKLDLKPDGRVKIADLGGGAAYASRALNYPTTVVDLNPHFIRRGGLVCSRLGISNTYCQVDMRKTGMADGSQDVAIASYSLHHLKQDEDERQIEEAVLEMNRILKRGGRVYLTFPWSAGEETLTRFAKGLAFYGFRIDTQASGAYCPLFDNGKKGKKILLIAAEKEENREGLAPAPEWDKFAIFSEKNRTRFVGDRVKKAQGSNGNGQEEEKKVVEFKKVGGIVL